MKIKKKAKDSLDKVLELFEDPEQLPEAIAKTTFTDSNKPSSEWSHLNRLIMYANDTVDARGYKQWQKANRQVKKGANAFYITGPLTKTVEEENENGETEKKTILYGFRPIPVFALEDTEGEPLPEPDVEDEPPLADIVEALGYEINFEFFDGNRAYTDTENKEIKLSTEDERTFFHELGHAIHNEIVDGGLDGGQRADQEIVAELTAATICNLYGFEGYLEQSFDYIKSYSNGDVYEAALAYIKDVEEVIDYLFNELLEKEPATV